MKDTLKEQISGLAAAIKELRGKEKQHIKIQTLVEQTEKSRVELDSVEDELKDVRADKAKSKAQKAMNLSGVVGKISEKTTRFLPVGDALFQIDENGLFIGLKRDEAITPYLSLSGGERAFFDLALCHALIGNKENGILIAEVAELDDDKLKTLLSAISEMSPKNQIILNTCHDIPEYPKDWNVIRLGEDL